MPSAESSVSRGEIFTKTNISHKERYRHRMTTIVATVIVLGVLIFVHEFGHFLLAKLLGVRVEIFSLGFPPRLLHKQIGDTDYRLSVVPLGGYVKLLGREPQRRGPRVNSGATLSCTIPCGIASSLSWRDRPSI